MVDSLGKGGAALSLPLGPGGRKRFGLQTCPGLGQTNFELTLEGDHLPCT